ncbi:hypothetical protein AAFF_G00323870 [Aldrovandia affinis]|uniref:Amidase domain-containing protein n=1 Tax=Aldrovandia affinis TaxID=143900 RepID=A0AAD7R762_9TELE|nr:hypothetical protein AAFF_G00323870 [Aldrovandia affinis]
MALTRFERLVAWALRACRVFLFAVFQLLAPRPSDGPSRRLPPITNPLLTVSGMQLAQKIRRKEVTSVEVVQAYIDRIQEVNPLINAMVKDRFSAALQEAAQADRLVEEEKGSEESLEDRLPLLGVPFTVKEAFNLQGMPNTTGLVSRRGVISGGDAPTVTLLKRAGAIPLGVTNSSELCMWMESHNRLYGITNNPYNIGRIPGGSSGGEGSILASGGSVIGVGSDIGGSIRLPAFFNGIFGHKPTSGVVSNEGQFPPCSGLQQDFLCTGPMCRYAEDLPLLLRLRQAQRQVVQRLEADLGVKVEELHIPQLRYSFHIWGAMMAAADKDGKRPMAFAELMGDHGKRVWPVWELAKWILGQSSHTMAAIGLALVEKTQSSQPSAFILQQKEELQTQLEELLGTDGVLLCPTHPHIAPKHHHPLFTPFDFSYTGIFNILGLPVTQCPVGLGREGLPLGLQLVAGKLQDHLTLATAHHLEKAFGGWREPGMA